MILFMPFDAISQSTEIIFLERDNYNTVNDLVEQFKGSYIYVDIWATWCKPCYEAFEHNAQLQEIIKGKPFKLLYISIDRTQHTTKWKRRIEKYNLSGYHIMANRTLQKDLWKLIHNQETRVEIPHYLIIDKSGNIKIKEAERPSQIEALKKQINNELLKGD